MIDFLQNFDWIQLLRCFVVGGIICIIGQILIDKTKLTPARILVLFVTVGAILGGLGIYQHLINFAGAGATVPITGFGANLAKGAIEEVQKREENKLMSECSCIMFCHVYEVNEVDGCQIIVKHYNI